jgi:response regulator RpfG family c-di-GMP phosphodiesterase
VQAIESRDPTTSGHSQRVAALSCRLAEAVSRTDAGSYAGVQFTTEQLKELRYAAVLHDFGKVGVREHILLKARKLYPLQQELIRSRFEFIKKSMEADTLKRKLEVVESRKANKPRLLAQLERQLSQRTKDLDDTLSFIGKCNQATSHVPGDVERLKAIARFEYGSYDGPRPFLTEEELIALSVLRGNLTQIERQEIERHVTHTFEFLSKIPWTRALKHVPMIAWTHHEKLDGTGYPRRLCQDQIPLQARIMTICDIYDALTASDRPYKAAVSTGIALGYLESQSREGKLDTDLVKIFTEERIYQATQPRSDLKIA